MQELLDKLSVPQSKIDVVEISNFIDKLDNNLPCKQQLAILFSEIKYKMNPIEELIKYIDNYEAFTVPEDNRHPFDFVNNLLTNEESKKILYAGVKENRSAREKFMFYLQDRLRNPLLQKNPREKQ